MNASLKRRLVDLETRVGYRDPERTSPYRFPRWMEPFVDGLSVSDLEVIAQVAGIRESGGAIPDDVPSELRPTFNRIMAAWEAYRAKHQPIPGIRELI